MQHPILLHVLHGADDLKGEISAFKFRQMVPLADQLGQRLISTQLEENVNVLIILEEVMKAYDVRVMQGLMYLELSLHFLSLAHLLQGGFLYQLAGEPVLCGSTHKLIASSEPALKLICCCDILTFPKNFPR